MHAGIRQCSLCHKETVSVVIRMEEIIAINCYRSNSNNNKHNQINNKLSRLHLNHTN